jgi:hypothetical protein
MTMLLSGIFLSVSFFSVASALPNHPPNPPIIEGETNGVISSYYNYSFTLTDPDDDILLNLEINWGDGTESVDCGCGHTWRNGTVIIVSHSFKKQGNYGITARIQDENGVWSNWSDPYAISMPKIQDVNTFILWISEQFSRFTMFFQLNRFT